ncbi:MAG: polyprenyl synthetase family protein [Clostridia bacterium]|nr:polyprenyl synthetase family protein [Clostridia bacterium]
MTFKTDFKGRLDQYAGVVNEAMQQFLPKTDGLEHLVIEAMRYSIEAGGKRIRPVLVLEFCRVCGGDTEAALPFACAIEMVHTYSLIHDDLPCMDDDALRRGRPSCHVKFGEATALLAGDALLSLAFEAALCNNYRGRLRPGDVILAAHELAAASGAKGMVGGQQIDLEYEGKPVGLEVLEPMHRGKTGAMIRAAAKMGCIVAGAPQLLIDAGDAYAQKLGLAFQIRDDILDLTSTDEALGKPAGSDLVNHKSTYATLLGLEESGRMLGELTRQAEECLRPFGEEGHFLRELARYLAARAG